MDKEKEGRAQEDPREQSVKESSTFCVKISNS